MNTEQLTKLASFAGKSANDFWMATGKKPTDVIAELTLSLIEANGKVQALAAENTYLINGAAGELNTSWMSHKTMLGAQAALMCIVRGDIRSARDWLEGTTEEAGADIPDDIAVSELQEWLDRLMVSNDGNSGFLTRKQAEEAIRKEIPATVSAVAQIKADAVKGIYSFNEVDCCVFLDGDVCMLIDAYEASLREAK